MTTLVCLKVLLCAAFSSTIASGQEVHVNFTLGEVVGMTETLSNGQQVVKYMAVPYAEAPVGDLRFRKPVPKAAWEWVLNATKEGPSCVQMMDPSLSQFIENTDISEDCLHLNIYVPVSTSKAPKAVMVWFHGGGYASGQGSMYPCSTLAAHGDIVCVTINYRVDILGFLSTMDENCVGNFGLWDQHEALKWVKKYISAFGGDPNRVTIFGQSAGAASVMFQLVSKHNIGVFQRGISESSMTMSNGYSMVPGNDARNYAKSVGFAAGCNTTDNPDLSDSKLLIDCLRRVPGENFRTISMTTYGPVLTGHVMKIPIGPVEDGDFVPLGLKEYFSSNGQKGQFTEIDQVFGSFDFMVGTTSEEANLMVSMWAGLAIAWNISISNGLPEDKIKMLLEDHLDVYYPKNRKESEIAINEVYFKADDRVTNTLALRDMFTHMFFTIHSLQSCNAHNNALTSPNEAQNAQRSTYMYEFSHHLNGTSYLEMISEASSPFKLPDWVEGATHGEELPYLFGFERYGKALNRSELWNAKDQEISEAVMTYWTNFAKTGNPNLGNTTTDVTTSTLPIWNQYSPNTKSYLDIGDVITPKQNPLPNFMELWLKKIPEIMQKTTPASNGKTNTLDKQCVLVFCVYLLWSYFHYTS
ncbi:cholinesterase 1 [Lingula anatina]|uniref:Carboxylic ester hydrolase n=1 Tax=Lingula anatina TaxID=7574 RepID=A0A1S3ICY4_LINAN|nr:cholinesterase 1 [Lingula anatina]|eukprot:XP_013395721.1 cholinesterase 1 [Lingula anatina]